MVSDSVGLRGAASAEEIAAVIAALHVVREPPEAGYARWRRQRLAALRASPIAPLPLINAEVRPDATRTRR